MFLLPPPPPRLLRYAMLLLFSRLFSPAYAITMPPSIRREAMRYAAFITYHALFAISPVAAAAIRSDVDILSLPCLARQR